MGRIGITLTIVALTAATGCVAETGSHQDELRLAIPTSRAHLHGRFYLNGQPFVGSAYHRGNIWLVATSYRGAPILLGSTHKKGYVAQVQTGTYDVYYDHTAGEYVPRNNMALVEQSVVISGSRVLDIHISATTVSGAFTINGETPTTSSYNYGAILIGREGEPLFEIGKTRDGSYETTMLLAGSYGAFYENVQTTGVAPANGLAHIDDRNLPLSPSTWDIDTPAVQVQWDATHNGESFPNSAYHRANLFLRDTETGAEVLLGDTRPSTVDALTLIPGTYDVIYEHIAGEYVPANERAVVLSAVEVDFEDPQDLELPFELKIPIVSIEINGSFSLDGAPFTTSSYHYGLFSLLDQEGGRIELGHSRDLFFKRLRLIPGAYDVLWERTAGSYVPINDAHLVMQDVDITAPIYLGIDMTSVQAQGFVSVPGHWPSGAFWARRLAVDCQYCPFSRLAGSEDADYLARIVPGTYEVVYSDRSTADEVAFDHQPVLGAWLVDSDVVQDLSIGGFTFF